MSFELKRCICGGEPKLHETRRKMGSHVQCHGCGRCTDFCRLPVVAATRWNMGKLLRTALIKRD